MRLYLHHLGQETGGHVLRRGVIAIAVDHRHGHELVCAGGGNAHPRARRDAREAQDARDHLWAVEHRELSDIGGVVGLGQMAHGASCAM